MNFGSEVALHDSDDEAEEISEDMPSAGGLLGSIAMSSVMEEEDDPSDLSPSHENRQLGGGGLVSGGGVGDRDHPIPRAATIMTSDAITPNVDAAPPPLPSVPPAPRPDGAVAGRGGDSAQRPAGTTREAVAQQRMGASSCALPRTSGGRGRGRGGPLNRRGPRRSNLGGGPFGQSASEPVPSAAAPPRRWTHKVRVYSIQTVGV